MTAEIITLADRRRPPGMSRADQPAVVYTVRISHFRDGTLSFHVADLADNAHTCKSIAWALRIGADLFDTDPPPRAA
jgi:hypothetical protein